RRRVRAASIQVGPVGRRPGSMFIDVPTSDVGPSSRESAVVVKEPGEGASGRRRPGLASNWRSVSLIIYETALCVTFKSMSRSRAFDGNRRRAGIQGDDRWVSNFAAWLS